MVNSEEFSNRLKKVFDYYELSASSFADKVDVGRASISHILSGRNKPSLDFVLKVVTAFEEVELYWLLNGKGTFPSSKEQELKPKEKPSLENKQAENNLDEKIITEQNQPILPQQNTSNTKKIEKVIIFYSDGSFVSYQNPPNY